MANDDAFEEGHKKGYERGYMAAEAKWRPLLEDAELELRYYRERAKKLLVEVEDLRRGMRTLYAEAGERLYDGNR